MSFGERQVDCDRTQLGLFAQSGSVQSMRPSRSSSIPLLHCSGPGGQFGAKRQPESAQSIIPSQSSSTPLAHGPASDTAQPQILVPMQSASLQSTVPSQSSSFRLLHTSPPAEGMQAH